MVRMNILVFVRCVYTFPKGRYGKFVLHCVLGALLSTFPNQINILNIKFTQVLICMMNFVSFSER